MFTFYASRWPLSFFQTIKTPLRKERVKICSVRGINHILQVRAILACYRIGTEVISTSLALLLLGNYRVWRAGALSLAECRKITNMDLSCHRGLSEQAKPLSLSRKRQKAFPKLITPFLFQLIPSDGYARV